MTEEMLIINLKDGSCDNKKITASLHYRQTNEQPKQMELLKKHRHSLLDKIHEDQKAIDCLDYIVYRIKTQ